MVIEFRRKETIFNTFLLPSKLSSSSHMIPLFFAFFSKNRFPTRSWFKEWHMRGEKKDLKSLVRAIWLWKRKTHYIESGKANLRAEDTCKLGYSCLPTNRGLSSKCHRMHHLPLKQTGNYTGERARAATPREENCWCVASSRPAFCNLDQKKKKKIPPLCTFTDRWLALPGSGCRNSCARPRHFPLQCLVYFPNAEEARHPWVLCEGWQTTPSADCACAGAATGRGQALPRCSSLQQQRAKVGAPC